MSEQHDKSCRCSSLRAHEFAREHGTCRGSYFGEQVTKEQQFQATFSALGSDLYWKLYDLEDGMLRWVGYDDANWWDNVAPKVTDQKGKATGRTYSIDFNTGIVEVLSP